MNRRFLRACVLILCSCATAFARISPDTPAYWPNYRDLDRLEAMGCAYSTFRAFAPQDHQDLVNAIAVPQDDDDEDENENARPKADPCQAPDWLKKERVLLTRPLLPPQARLEFVWLKNDLTPLLGTEATVTPTFDLRENRPTFNGPNLYTELSVAAESTFGPLGFAIAATPGWLGALEDPHSLEGRFYLHEGYLKAGYRWTELTFGRTALRFGETAHGSLLLSAASNPIDLVKLSVRPHLLGSAFGFLGPVTFNTFLTPPLRSSFVNGDRLWGIELGFRPLSWLELGLLELYQFGGDGVPGLGFTDYLKMAVYSGSSDLDAKRNRSFGLNLALWLASHRAKLYSQFYFDSLGRVSDWLSKDASALGGLWLPHLGSTELRLEYVHTVPNAYLSKRYGQGLTYEGSPLGHPLGPDAEGAYLDFGLPPMGGDWRPTLGALYESRGISNHTALNPKAETRLGGSVGIKKRWQLLELDAQAVYHLIKNSLYQPVPDSTAFAGFVAFRYSFL